MKRTPPRGLMFFDDAISDDSPQHIARAGSCDYGYSLLELDRAGISESRALALGLPVDGARRSALRRNIRHLKGIVR
jgi:ribosomal protein L13E